MKENRDRLVVLDSLRGICALIIAIVWHYQHFKPLNYPFYKELHYLYQYGYMLVETFFCISGFVICYSYKNEILNNGLQFFCFIKKRIIKLFPMMFITLIIVTIEQFIFLNLTGETFQYKAFDAYHFILNLLMIQVGWLDNTLSFNGPAWCISVEIMLYIIFYIVLKLSSKKNYVIPCFFILICIGIFFYLNGYNNVFINNSTVRGIISFSIGVILSEIYLNKKNTVKLDYVLACICVIFLLPTFYFTPDKFWGKGSFNIVYILFLSPLTIWSIIKIPILRKVLSFKPLVYLGKCSLSIYLVHFPIQCLIKLLDISFKWRIDYSKNSFFIVYSCVIIVASIFAYEFVEKKQNKFYNYLINVLK